MFRVWYSSDYKSFNRSVVAVEPQEDDEAEENVEDLLQQM